MIYLAELVVAVGFRDELEVKSLTGETDLGPLKSTHEEADTILPSTASFIRLLCLHEILMFSYFSYHTFKECNVSIFG